MNEYSRIGEVTVNVIAPHSGSTIILKRFVTTNNSSFVYPVIFTMLGPRVADETHLFDVAVISKVLVHGVVRISVVINGYPTTAVAGTATKVIGVIVSANLIVTL